jgi:hypothetical protein
MNYRSGEAPDHLKRSRVARATLRGVDQNAVPSRFLHDVFGAYGIRSEIIPNIVDLERFRFRRREHLQPRLLSTRNFEPLYNLPCTLRAFRLIQDRYPEAQLTLVGSGSQDAALRRMVADLRLAHVTFTGRVPPEDIWRYYAEADIYLQTPNIDNMPSSVLEAFASGCAVVATNAGGVPAILTDGLHGLLVNCDDHQAAADAVFRLLDDSVLAQRLAGAAFDTVCALPVVLGPRAVGLPLSAHGEPERHGRSDPCMNRPGVLARVAAMDREELRVRLIEAVRKYAGRVEYSIRPPQWSRGRITRILDRGAGPEVRPRRRRRPPRRLSRRSSRARGAF